ncbi:MAG: TetR family transcriptional regulator [Actinomycetota bacterium]
MSLSRRRGARSGRRPGATRTRDAILEAARRQFGAGGYDRTSLRRIASEAGVDQALIVHFFGSKIALFSEVVALPIDPATAIPHILEGPREELGVRAASFVVGVLENDHARATVTALVRAATSEPEAARLVRERLTHDLWGPLARELAVEDADLRVSLVGSQIIGLVLARYVVQVEPLASLPPDQVVSLIAPTLQRYFVDAV